MADEQSKNICEFYPQFTSIPLKKQVIYVDWAELPVELLIGILEKHLVSLDDYVALLAVCRSWRNAAVCCSSVRLKQNWTRQMPWLMLIDSFGKVFDNNAKDIGCSTNRVIVESDQVYGRSVLNLRQGKLKRYNFECRQGYRRTCWGSAHGWILAHGIQNNMYLFNPLTKAQLDLPSCHTLPSSFNNTAKVNRSYIIKGAICKLPSGNHHTSLVVVVIYELGCRVAFAKPGDKKWTGIEELASISVDAVYHRDGLFLVSVDGNLGYYDLHAVPVAQPPKLTWYGCKAEHLINGCSPNPYGFVNPTAYLVNFGEDLLMVLRIYGPDKNLDSIDDLKYYKTAQFKVYKFQFQDKGWEELQDLQDAALFVGCNATISVCASEAGCQQNCIYYMDDLRQGYSANRNRLGGNDMGVFRMDDKSIQPLNVDVMSSNMRCFHCCSVWFNTSL